MGVYRKRSTTSAPLSLSISYLIGSPPIGTSITTLTSSGAFLPIRTAFKLTSELQIRERRPAGGGVSKASYRGGWPLSQSRKRPAPVADRRKSHARAAKRVRRAGDRRRSHARCPQAPI